MEFEDRWKPYFPDYEFDLDGSSLNIFSGKACLDVDGKKVECSARCDLVFSPYQKITIFVTDAGMLDSTNVSSFSTIKLDSIGEFEVLLRSRLRDAGDEHSKIVLNPKETPVRFYSSKANVHEVKFHLFDFPQISSDLKLIGNDGGSILALEGMILKEEHWTVRLNSVKNTGDAIKKTENDGITRMTHVACLKKSDDTTFSAEEFSDIWILLVNFFTFLKGGRTWPVMSTGYSNDRPVLHYWSAPQVSNNNFSWFNPDDPSLAEAFFPLFTEIWNRSSEWTETLDRVILWYAKANTLGVTPGNDVGIIMAQAALERLAYQYLVVDENTSKFSEPNEFGKLRASCKIRKLCESLGIPLHITDVTPDIFSEKHVVGWEDIPHALTDIRNLIVHPKKKHQKSFQKCYFEAWIMSVWLLELCILGVCGYNGKYKNRLERPYCPTVSVPWAGKDS